MVISNVSQSTFILAIVNRKVKSSSCKRVVSVFRAREQVDPAGRLQFLVLAMKEMVPYFVS